MIFGIYQVTRDSVNQIIDYRTAEGQSIQRMTRDGINDDRQKPVNTGNDQEWHEQ